MFRCERAQRSQDPDVEDFELIEVSSKEDPRYDRRGFGQAQKFRNMFRFRLIAACRNKTPAELGNDLPNFTQRVMTLVEPVRVWKGRSGNRGCPSSAYLRFFPSLGLAYARWCTPNAELASLRCRFCSTRPTASCKFSLWWPMRNQTSERTTITGPGGRDLGRFRFQRESNSIWKETRSGSRSRNLSPPLDFCLPVPSEAELRNSVLSSDSGSHS